jgi:hypothetical protein
MKDRRTGAPPLAREICLSRIEAIHECLEEGFPHEYPGGRVRNAFGEAARRLGIDKPTLQNCLNTAERCYGLKVDPQRFQAKPVVTPFQFDELPFNGEPDAEELIALLTERHAVRKIRHEATKLRQVAIGLDGPIALGLFGDPHIDDPGCAWGDLERDVRICRDVPGFLAVDVGDDSNNWVGRLMKLYADQEVTSGQSLKLIEWLMTSLPWLLRIKGNHDNWNTEKGDPADYIHRLANSMGALEPHGARLQLNLPAGASLRIHVRHDFPGGSQFNPAHAMVRETLFGHRDHILACGHRHTAGYIPIWHNDPRRLCHGMRLGTYKDFDHYAAEKGFQDGNWARSMAAVVDPDFADDPVRFIKVFFSLEEAAEFLTWRRAKWDVGSRAA